MDYIPRLMDDHLDLLMESSGAVVIQGPKWSGKTTTALRKSGSSLMLGDTATYNNARAVADVVVGDGLRAMVSSVERMGRRECYARLEGHLRGRGSVNNPLAHPNAEIG